MINDFILVIKVGVERTVTRVMCELDLTVAASQRDCLRKNFEISARRALLYS